MNKQYQDTLKRRVVQQYIVENNRSPSPEKLRELIQIELNRRADLDIVGFSSLDITKPGLGSESSATEERILRTAIQDDYQTIGKRIDTLSETLEDAFRANKNTFNRIAHMLGAVESRLNNLLLLKGKADHFTYGIEEVFDTQNFVDYKTTTATIEGKVAGLRRSNRTLISLADAKLRFSSIGKAGVILASATTPISTLKEADGKFWEYHVLSPSAVGRVNCIVDIELKEATFVSDIKIVGSSIGVNSQTKINVFYSIDGKAYFSAGTKDAVLNTGETVFGIGADQVLKIRILLSKDASDEKDGTAYLYLFSLDSIELYSDTYTASKESVLYLGPYSVYDELGNPVNFSMATIQNSTCCELPEGTQVGFFLSKDNESWKSASCSGPVPSIVSFSNLNPIGSMSYLDPSLNENSLTTSILPDMDIEFGKEVYSNLYVTSDYADKIVLQNILFKRNLPNSYDLYGTKSGWFYNQNLGTYSCYFYIESHEGRYFEFGNTSAKIDGRAVTGSVYVQSGYHSFETNRTNWLNVTNELTTLDDLKAEDILYPYNHKLLIEGYDYTDHFSGEEIYNGADSYFGVLCSYVSPERFYAEHDGNLTVYTIEYFDGNLFFKVKTDPGDFSWQNEEVEIEYMLRSDSSNELYIKAILTTSNVKYSPKIHSIRIRVL